MNTLQSMWRLLLVMMLTPLLPVSLAYPSDTARRNTSFMTRRSLLDCSVDVPLRETCERCAKDSGSTDAFVWCCGNEEGIREWCREFLEFGRHNGLVGYNGRTV